MSLWVMWQLIGLIEWCKWCDVTWWLKGDVCCWHLKPNGFEMNLKWNSYAFWCIKQTQNRKSKVDLLCRLSLIFFILSITRHFLFLKGSELPNFTKENEGSKCVLWQNKSASTLRDHAKVIREVYPWAGKPFGEAWSFKIWSEGTKYTIHSNLLPW